MSHWNEFEERVRLVAETVYGCRFAPERIAGVDADAVGRPALGQIVVVEATVRRDLAKIREDINRLRLMRSKLVAEDLAPRVILVMEDDPSPSMFETAAAAHVELYSAANFLAQWFSPSGYIATRLTRRFGSAANPMTGKPDNTDYVPVRYSYPAEGRDMKLEEIERRVRDGQTVVLVGDYGTGKSRCVRELFVRLAPELERTSLAPIAINLRNHWGLTTAEEVVRRHFDLLGLSEHADSVIRALTSTPFVFLLDGFDEIGSQAWSQDRDRVRQQRRLALQGVRELATRAPAGLLVTGRAGYFDSESDMLECLGVASRSPVVVRCYDEFDSDEIKTFLARIDAKLELPVWLPRRPLVAQVLLDLPPAQIAALVECESALPEFWTLFSEYLCRREAEIRSGVEPAAVAEILRRLARATRTKITMLGPISRDEVGAAFEAATGFAPVGESAIIAQRLPGLTRLEAESDDRHFIDQFVLDGFAAEQLMDDLFRADSSLFAERWHHALSDRASTIAAAQIEERSHLNHLFHSLDRAFASENKVLRGDLLTVLAEYGSLSGTVDCGNRCVSGASIRQLDLDDAPLANITLREVAIDRLVLPSEAPDGLRLEACYVSRCFGAADHSGLPPWVDVIVDADTVFEVLRTNVAVLTSDLAEEHKILLTYLRKLFFQAGSARQKDSLLRGLGELRERRSPDRVLNVLRSHGWVKFTRGDNGVLVVPERKFTARARLVCDRMGSCEEAIWYDLAGVDANRGH